MSKVPVVQQGGGGIELPIDLSLFDVEVRKPVSVDTASSPFGSTEKTGRVEAYFDISDLDTGANAYTLLFAHSMAVFDTRVYVGAGYTIGNGAASVNTTSSPGCFYVSRTDMTGNHVGSFSFYGLTDKKQLRTSMSWRQPKTDQFEKADAVLYILKVK